MDTASQSLLRRAVFLAGPTSVGKSEIALTLAEKHHGEIVCADAFQLYREFPVLSAQPSAAERARVVHHLSGTVPCSDEMDAARFASLALDAIAGIVAREKIPFVVGGSGLYLQALVAGLPALPAIDPALRDRVRGMALKDMTSKLRELDPESLTAIDANNPRRVARRLELCLQTGLPASQVLEHLPTAPDGLRGILLTRPRDAMHERIAAAVAARLGQGAVDEVRAARGTAGRTARQILGWREITAFLDAEITMDECREKLVFSTRQYAKRQLTWFRSKSTFPQEEISEVTPDSLDRIARSLGLS
ncbi:MAG: tRNA (adenosine(37)-N6)-dimethylallyltransferase MiaA [Chthoniobacterales bacterium]|nr:tRNA (adenosine(37)-N6)-dimethylallyltransferase MiaA [Chthoniobacterales bacterium]